MRELVMSWPEDHNTFLSTEARRALAGQSLSITWKDEDGTEHVHGGTITHALRVALDEDEPNSEQPPWRWSTVLIKVEIGDELPDPDEVPA